jgi:hypothetical protein
MVLFQLNLILPEYIPLLHAVILVKTCVTVTWKNTLALKPLDLKSGMQDLEKKLNSFSALVLDGAELLAWYSVCF